MTDTHEQMNTTPSIRIRAWNVLRIALGLVSYPIAGLLFLAAALKSYSALTGAVLPSELTVAHRFTGPLVAIEACLAVWIISGAAPRISWAVALILFRFSQSQV
jgi:hypothetical protein